MIGGGRTGGAPTLGIAAPVSAVEEVELLASNGATEFYCGVAPESWAARFGPSWLNRRARGKANLPSLDHVASLVEASHARGVPVSVTLNAPFYTGDQLGDVVALAKDLVALGADGLIVSDAGLILALREQGVEVKLTLSSVAAVQNAGACEFFRDLGVNRVVLPRHVRVSEVEALHARVPDVALEVFVLNDGCVYEEGHCATTHALGAFCLTPWRYGLTRRDGAPPDEAEREAFEDAAKGYREWIWYTNNCGSTISDRGLPNGPCGLCAIWDLHRAGVSCFKIVGRESNLFRKVRSLRLVLTVVEEVRKGSTREQVASLARALRDTPDLCHSGYMCYYRDACPARLPG